MRNFQRTHSKARKLILLIPLLLLAASPSSTQTCRNWTEYVYYYSDETKTQEVGFCEFACYCQTWCQGQQTAYTIRHVYRVCL